MTSKTIGVNKEAYLHLDRISRVQRGCKPLNKELEDRMWNRCCKKNGLKIIDDFTIGGGDGNYYGKWTSWSVDTIKSMLKDAGYSWKEEDDIEFYLI